MYTQGTHKCMHTQTHMHIRTHMHVHTQAHRCTHAYTYINTYVFTYVHAQTHIHASASLMRAKLLLAPPLDEQLVHSAQSPDFPAPRHLDSQVGLPILVTSACFIHSACQRVII